MPEFDERLKDMTARMDRIQKELGEAVDRHWFDERDKVNQESHRRIEDICRDSKGDLKDLRREFEEAEKDRRVNARTLRNMVLAALASAVLSVIVSLVAQVVVK
jgi:hypothetical protein